MTPVLRRACDVAPLILIVATTRGSRESFGRFRQYNCRAQKCPVMTAASGEDEEKATRRVDIEGRADLSLTIAALTSGGRCFARWLTPLIRTRILGRSETPVRVARDAFRNGDNIAVEGDVTRRTIQCNLDPRMERPELQDFAFDPIEHVMATGASMSPRRSRLHGPTARSGERTACEPIASYEQWSRVVREPLVWLAYERDHVLITGDSLVLFLSRRGRPMQS